ncbi:MAG: extracellular solute-binding protein [Gammaproteobacteria bacterium]|nr:extracellular solute-binding protein [Gammaproteobacteria bacterium]
MHKATSLNHRWYANPTSWVAIACLICTSLVHAQTEPCANPQYQHGWSYVLPLKYDRYFEHFDYNNPNAPKGGILRMPQLGTFDNYNFLPDKGRLLAGYESGGPGALIYDSLMTGAADESQSAYGRLAEGIAVERDYRWVAFKIRENAYWHDGTPLTVDDVVWTFESFLEHGNVGLKTALRDLDRVYSFNEREVCFVTKEGAEINPATPFIYGGQGILPKHYWADKDLSKTVTDPPLGSGPYQLTEVDFGQLAVYERFDEYWGKDVPSMRGRYNYDKIQWDYFRDEQVITEAHKAGVLDFREETVSKNWTVKYDFPEVAAGLFQKRLIYLKRSWGMWWPAFWNVRIERFQDRRVREALFLLYDFPWINRVILHGFYDYGNSFFYNSEMAWEGLPSEAELALLEPIRDMVPPRVFTEEFDQPESDGYGTNRDAMKRAIELFDEAGWTLKSGELRHKETDERFKVDFVFVSPMLLRAKTPFMKRLNQVGIETSAVAPEVSNWQHRMRARKFDGGGYIYIPSNMPGIDLRNRFGSAAADEPNSLNWAGVKNPAVDYLIDKVNEARTADGLFAATRALDRVLLWEFYMVPGMGQPGYRAVYWDRFSYVDSGPLNRVPVIDAWWWDPEKERALQAGLAELRGN